MRPARQAAGALAIVLLAVLSACSSTGDETPSTRSRATTLTKEPPIAGLIAPEVLAQAQAALPGSIREDFLEPAPPGYLSVTKSAIGLPKSEGGTPNGATPGIDVSWVEDGTVIYVSCADLTSAGQSTAIEFCTNLDIPGVPAGGVKSVWQQYSAGTWTGSQPFPQITISAFPYDGDGPSFGPSLNLGISGPSQASITATESSSL